MNIDQQQLTGLTGEICRTSFWSNLMPNHVMSDPICLSLLGYEASPFLGFQALLVNNWLVPLGFYQWVSTTNLTQSRLISRNEEEMS